MLELLDVFATVILAIGAIAIAWQANRISNRSVQVEADKHVFEWGQRCLNCLSRISSLRLIGEGQIKAEDFRTQRRDLRAELFALAEEGALFFGKEGQTNGEPALQALHVVAACLDGRSFVPPKKDDYDSKRKGQNEEIRIQTKLFIAAIQSRVGDEWSSRREG